MCEVSKGVSTKALVAKKKLASNFFKKGISLALFSGLAYGLYTAFLTMGMTKGVWGTGTALIQQDYQHLL